MGARKHEEWFSSKTVADATEKAKKEARRLRYVEGLRAEFRDERWDGGASYGPSSFRLPGERKERPNDPSDVDWPSHQVPQVPPLPKMTSKKQTLRESVAKRRDAR